MRRRPVIVAVLAFGVAAAVVASVVLGPARPAIAEIPPNASPTPFLGGELPPPLPGHEVYGFVPYWEMDAGIADHLASTDLSTLGLFSVTHGRGGHLATTAVGYRRIVGPIGRRMISEARARGTRTELVYSSFGETKNSSFFGSLKAQDTTITELVRLATDLGVDGLNVDVEQLALGDIPAYGLFVGRLREALRVAIPKGQVSVATTANEGGAAMAAAASVAGADRVFVMGYDYRTAGSAPGASAPLDRHDGVKDLPWSLDLYRAAGVPVERTILGLPLYGMAWPVASPEQGAASTGRGAVWIPRRNLDLLTGAAPVPTYDPVESVDFLAVPDGAGWRAIYLDTPTSLTPKLRLANERGLAGAGFWAIGYERGLPEYTRLIERFRADRLPTVEAAAESTPGVTPPSFPAAPSP
ncbi:MAG TPA: glycosyl hydrolase family 18 protein [Candidatus Dormibacteraeota bacterium]|nr:glycosyl hydrolase family 18 protein [Candidatus Dormibacteraeota bacterium]